MDFSTRHKAGRCLHRSACIFVCAIMATVFVPVSAIAQGMTDESKVPKYTLPDLLQFSDGAKVSNAEQWEKRRNEILELFRIHMYGRAPGRPATQEFDVFEKSVEALNGKAIRRQVRITVGQGEAKHSFDLLIYLPKAAPKPVATFLVLNFYGNHSVHADPGIRLSEAWMRPKREMGVVNNRATEKSRGVCASRHSIEMVLSNGYAYATMYYGDIDPDFDDGFKNGIHRLGYGSAPVPPKGEQWGSIAAWAWGASRALDYLETDQDIDAARVAIMGHSRLGKTALLAGAEDIRFAMVISNNSGCGGAAISRRKFGETVARINQSCPHWFNDNFMAYGNKEEELPVDQHMLIALMAPRPVYVASATEDLWADPKGEFLSAKYASPAYDLLGKPSLAEHDMPKPNQPIHTTLGYHLRTGKHDVTSYDWEQYLKFADTHLKEK